MASCLLLPHPSSQPPKTHVFLTCLVNFNILENHLLTAIYIKGKRKVEENTTKVQKQRKNYIALEMFLCCSTYKSIETTNFWQRATLASSFAICYLTGNQTQRYLDDDIPFSLLGNNLPYTATNQFNDHLK